MKLETVLKQLGYQEVRNIITIPSNKEVRFEAILSDQYLLNFAQLFLEDIDLKKLSLILNQGEAMAKIKNQSINLLVDLSILKYSNHSELDFLETVEMGIRNKVRDDQLELFEYVQGTSEELIDCDDCQKNITDNRRGSQLFVNPEKYYVNQNLTLCQDCYFKYKVKK